MRVPLDQCGAHVGLVGVVLVEMATQRAEVAPTVFAALPGWATGAPGHAPSQTQADVGHGAGC